MLINRKQLYAIERSLLRFKTMEKMLELSNCSNVVAQRADFLETDPVSTEYSKVTRMLVSLYQF